MQGRRLIHSLANTQYDKEYLVSLAHFTPGSQIDVELLKIHVRWLFQKDGTLEPLLAGICGTNCRKSDFLLFLFFLKCDP